MVKPEFVSQFIPAIEFLREKKNKEDKYFDKQDPHLGKAIQMKYLLDLKSFDRIKTRKKSLDYCNALPLQYSPLLSYFYSLFAGVRQKKNCLVDIWNSNDEKAVTD